MEQERADSQGGTSSSVLLQADNLERVLMARLLNPPDPSSRPWDYLLASYGRASQEINALSSMRNKVVAARLSQLLTGLKQLLVSYSGLLLSMSMFPQVHLRGLAACLIQTTQRKRVLSSRFFDRAAFYYHCLTVSSFPRHWSDNNERPAAIRGRAAWRKAAV